MGNSASSLLDGTKSTFIKGQAESELKDFSPYYRKQFSVARFCQVEDDLEQNKQKITQLLQQRGAPEEGEVLYEEDVLYFDDTRKWRDRYVVVRANYCLELHDSLETFLKGVPPFHKLLPTGGAVLTTEEPYMALVDKCFPDDSSLKEEFAPPQSGMPGQFPVYLRLPYRRDSYFCFKQQAKQAGFISILSDCIRHQNQDFLKKKTCEVQAFLKAIQLYRQDRGRYEAWDMLMGSDVRVMANLVMEQLLPSLEKDILLRLKAKKTERKRLWFATMEAAYILVQEQLLEGLSALKQECQTLARQQEVLIHSDMDQILNSRRQLEEQIRAKVSEPAERLCSESVQPYLGSVLEELMEPVSSGFLEGRQLCENMMDKVCGDVQGADKEQLNKTLADLARLNLLSCYQKISSLQDKLQDLQERFGFSGIAGVIHSAQIDLQQLTDNAAHTFEQLLCKAVQDNADSPAAAGSAVEKAKHRVLKQYDYDSSTVRKRIFQDALVSITLPFIKSNLAQTCRAELQGLEQMIYTDHSDFIHVENVYESILLQILGKEVTKVVKEAASLKKHNLITDSRDLISQSSRSSLSSPPVSTPSSPDLALVSPIKDSSEPPSPLVVNGVSSIPHKEENFLQREASTDVMALDMPLGKVEPNEATPGDDAGQEVELPAAKVKEVQTVKAEEGNSSELEPPASAEPDLQTEKQNTAAPEAVIQEEVTSIQTGDTQAAAEPQTLSRESLQEPEVTSSAESISPEAAAAAAAAQNRECTPVTKDTGSQPAGSSQPQSSAVDVEAPSAGEEPEDTSLYLKEERESVTLSEPDSLDVSVGSEWPPSDLESTDEVSVTCDVSKGVEATVSPEETAEDNSAGEEHQMKAQSSDDGEAGASMTVEVGQAMTSPSQEAPPDPKDSIKEIRDLVVEVIEVEEPVQRYPSGAPEEE
ncbi:protein Niban 1a [Xenentodon cancila]